MTRPLNFLHFSTFYPPYSFGGDATYLHRLCHLLGDAGNNVDVVHCVDSFHLAQTGQPNWTFAEHPNVSRHELRSQLTWLSPMLTQQTGHAFLKMRKVRQILARRKYDVVHYHNTSLLGPKILTVKPHSAEFIKLYTMHEHWLVCPMHVLWKFGRRPCDKPTCLRCQLYGRRPPQLWRYTGLLDRCCRHVDQFISPSRFTAAMHRDRGFRFPIDVLPHFVQPDASAWQASEKPPQVRPYFLFVGRLEKIKGLQSVIPLWDNLRDVDLLVAGTGSYESELRRIAAANPAIKFLGSQSQSQLGNLYRHALACVVPSITFETFGIICIESFASKTPVIARNLGALPEIIKESNGGFVYTTDNELLDSMNRIVHSRALRDELGENGYRAYQEKWTAEAHLRQYFALLEKTARQKFGRVPWQGNRPQSANEPQTTQPATS